MTDSARTEVDGLLRRLLGRSGPELGCEQCFDELDRYVELELAGADAGARTCRAAPPATRSTRACARSPAPIAEPKAADTEPERRSLPRRRTTAAAVYAAR